MSRERLFEIGSGSQEEIHREEVAIATTAMSPHRPSEVNEYGVSLQQWREFDTLQALLFSMFPLRVTRPIPALIRTMTALRRKANQVKCTSAILINEIATADWHKSCANGRAGQGVWRFKPMFRAEIQWLEKAPILKMAGKLVGDWAEQARNLVTKDVVPKGLMIDLTEVSYIDPAGEEFLKWLASIGAVVVAGNVYAMAVCERLRLAPAQKRAERPKHRHANDEEGSSVRHFLPVEVI